MSFSDYSTTPASNTTIAGASMAENATSPASINDAIRQLMADGKALSDTVASNSSAKVSKTGDTMTGALTLPGAPTNANHAATKAYIDALTTPSTLLALLQSVDGPGSNLDADFLDGYQATAFLRKEAGGFTSSNYTRLSDGLIIQWVSVFVGSPSSAISFSWPIAFPTAVLAVVPGGRNGLAFSGSYSAYCRNITTSGGSVYGNNGAADSSTVNIIAIGN